MTIFVNAYLSPLGNCFALAGILLCKIRPLNRGFVDINGREAEGVLRQRLLWPGLFWAKTFSGSLSNWSHKQHVTVARDDYLR